MVDEAAELVEVDLEWVTRLEAVLALHAAGAELRSAGSYRGALAAARRQQHVAPDEHALYIPAGGTSPRSMRR